MLIKDKFAHADVTDALGIKYLEEKNSEYINNNMDLEEELGKVSKKKPQTDLFRKQVSERYQAHNSKILI